MKRIIFGLAVLLTISVFSTSCGDEESGVELGLTETYNEVRNGVRLILSYNDQTKMFEGTVENTTTSIAEEVRVEVHLSNGTELGPTTPEDLAASASRDITIDATNETFEGWVPHVEVD